jgi:DoxX-like family
VAVGLTPFRHRRTRLLSRASLIALWLLTAVVSVVELQGQSRALLAAAHTPDAWIAPLILAGAGLDLTLGLALWRWHRRWVYLSAGLAMLGMTLVGTLLLPDLWLDPLGRLSKNLPIAALLLILHEDAPA